MRAELRCTCHMTSSLIPPFQLPLLLTRTSQAWTPNKTSSRISHLQTLWNMAPKAQVRCIFLKDHLTRPLLVLKLCNDILLNWISLVYIQGLLLFQHNFFSFISENASPPYCHNPSGLPAIPLCSAGPHISKDSPLTCSSSSNWGPAETVLCFQCTLNPQIFTECFLC